MNIPELLVKVDEDLVDLSLGLAQYRLNSDWSSDFVATASWNEQRLSVGGNLSAEWEEQAFEEGGPAVFWGTLTLLRTGPESDEFLKTLAEVYDSETAPPQMADKVEFSAAALAGHPSRPQDGSLRLKLFFNADDEERYAELYCLIDYAKRRVEFREVDLDFRDAILDAFSRLE